MGPANGACLQFNPSPFRPVIKARGRAARGVGACFRRAEKEAGKFFQENESAGGRLLRRGGYGRPRGKPHGKEAWA